MTNPQTFTTPCALFGLVAVLLLTSCRSGVPEPLVDLPLRQASAEELVTLLDQRSGGIQSLRALLQIQARGKFIPIRRSMNMSLSYVRPSFIRLRAFDLFGRTLFDLTSDQTHYHVHLPTQDRVVTGIHTSSSENPPSETPSKRQRMLRLVKVVAETVLASPIGDGHHVTLHEEGFLYRIEVAEHSRPARLLRQLWIERINLDVVKEAVFDDTGDPIIIVEFDDYRAIGPRGEVQYPFHLSIHDVATNNRYTLKFQEVLPNPTLSPTEFDALQS
ncbi:MAG TPA: hypothetical protein EYN60_05005 [Nitrospirales bacterium]|nr:hypothetical protein [Nitrospirales bacterium]